MKIPPETLSKMKRAAMKAEFYGFSLRDALASPIDHADEVVEAAILQAFSVWAEEEQFGQCDRMRCPRCGVKNV